MPRHGEHPEGTTADAAGAVMDLLHNHVPLTLLLDLASVSSAKRVLMEEGIPDERWWECAKRSGPAGTPYERPSQV